MAGFEVATEAYNATDPEYEVSEEEAEMSLLTHQIREELLRHYERGVCCFSTVFNSALLWSHYGDEHRGICIGYDLKRIPRPTLHQVVYGGDRTIWTSALDAAFLQKDLRAIEAVDRDVLLRKAPGWRYEREWRLIGSKGVQDSCLRLSDVTFGLRCPEAVKHSVIRALDGREEVSFYEIYEQECTFRLSRRMVQIDELQSWFPRTARSGAEIFNEDITSQE